MIAIVSSSSRERGAFVSLCEARGWTAVECDSLRALAALIRRSQPAIVLVRQRLVDGYSDDVLNALDRAGLLPDTKVIALVAAGSASSLEARQIALGADCVQRDPVRTDVLLEYLAKYSRMGRRPQRTNRAAIDAMPFAGGTLHVTERKLRHRGRTVSLTPREVQLAEFLAQSDGSVVSYEALFYEILRQRFRGDTSNMRVLLGKLSTSARRAGVSVRRWVEVIPKSGYRYREPSPVAFSPPRSRRPLLSAA